jgi:hypothetical protein
MLCRLGEVGSGHQRSAEPIELATESPAQYWEMISEHVSPAVAALEHLDEATRERIGATVIANVSAYERDGTVRVPGLARCIAGTKSGRAAL